LFQNSTTLLVSASVTNAPCTRINREDPGGRNSMSPSPSRCSAPITSSTVRESTRVATRKLIREGKLALINPVMTSTLGRCVASTRCMPTARGIWTRWVGALQHDEIRQPVDQDDDIRERLQLLFL